MRNKEVYLNEIEARCRAAGDPLRAGVAKNDKKSNLRFFAIRVPELRKICASPFSFYCLSHQEILDVWILSLEKTQYFEIISLVFMYYRQCPHLLDHAPEPFFQWSRFVENWSHCDELGGLLAKFVEQDRQRHLTQLTDWNQADDRWLNRLSLTSAIHYVGSKSTFLPFLKVQPLLAAHLNSTDPYVARAVGWVIREYLKSNDEDALTFLSNSKSALSGGARSKLKGYL